jgi:sterol 3beta-glucosyltransferase
MKYLLIFFFSFFTLCIKKCNFVQVKEAALELAKGMEKEDGIQGAVNAFHKHLSRDLKDLLSEKPLPRQRRRGNILYRFRKRCTSLIRR